VEAMEAFQSLVATTKAKMMAQISGNFLQHATESLQVTLMAGEVAGVAEQSLFLPEDSQHITSLLLWLQVWSMSPAEVRVADRSHCTGHP